MVDDNPACGHLPMLPLTAQRSVLRTVSLRVRPILADVQVEINMDTGPVARRTDEPCIEVDEHGPCERAVFVDRVSAHVIVPNGELVDSSAAGWPDESVDEEPGVVAGLDVWLFGRVERGAIDGGPVEGDGLDLMCSGSVEVVAAKDHQGP